MAAIVSEVSLTAPSTTRIEFVIVPVHSAWIHQRQSSFYTGSNVTSHAVALLCMALVLGQLGEKQRACNHRNFSVLLFLEHGSVARANLGDIAIILVTLKNFDVWTVTMGLFSEGILYKPLVLASHRCSGIVQSWLSTRIQAHARILVNGYRLRMRFF